jgi:hypothetical protein
MPERPQVQPLLFWLQLKDSSGITIAVRLIALMYLNNSSVLFKQKTSVP